MCVCRACVSRVCVRVSETFCDMRIEEQQTTVSRLSM